MPVKYRTTVTLTPRDVKKVDRLSRLFWQIERGDERRYRGAALLMLLEYADARVGTQGPRFKRKRR